MSNGKGKGNTPRNERSRKNAGAGEGVDEQALAFATAPIPAEQLEVTGSVLALAQSLKVMAEQAGKDGRTGWQVIAKRAEGFVRAMALHVTRLLAHPDLRLRHASLDFDLRTLGCDVLDTGRVHVRVTDARAGGWWAFPLEELYPTGPAGDAVREAVQLMMGTVVEDIVGQLVAQGGLPGLGALREFTRREFSAGGSISVGFGEQLAGEPQSETVHHLTVPGEFVMEPDGPHAEPADLCPGCHLPLHICMCD
jgi:hypothetical protein